MKHTQWDDKGDEFKCLKWQPPHAWEEKWERSEKERCIFTIEATIATFIEEWRIVFTKW